ncbi:MAG: hypothetical protein U0T84_11260 [Chitinophagales bacterium]
MKSSFSVWLMVLFAGINFSANAQDDVYYDPKKDRGTSGSDYQQQYQNSNTNNAQVPTNQGDGNNTDMNNQDRYDRNDGYSNAGGGSGTDRAYQYDGNSSSYANGGNTYITNNYYDDDYWSDDDYLYTTRLRRYYYPNYGTSYYDTWFTPNFYWGMPRVSINYGFSPWYSYGCWNRWNCGYSGFYSYYDPWFSNYGCGYGPSSYWGWNNWYYSNWYSPYAWGWHDPYWNGYYSGYYSSYYGNNYYDHGYRTSSVHYGPRREGSTSGSNTSNASDRPRHRMETIDIPREGVQRPREEGVRNVNRPVETKPRAVDQPSERVNRDRPDMPVDRGVNRPTELGNRNNGTNNTFERNNERPTTRPDMPVRNNWDNGNTPVERPSMQPRQERNVIRDYDRPSPRNDQPRMEQPGSDQPRQMQPRNYDQPRMEQRNFDQPRMEQRNFDQPRQVQPRSFDQPRNFDQPRSMPSQPRMEQPRNIGGGGGGGGRGRRF